MGRRVWLALLPAALVPSIVSLLYFVTLSGTWAGRALYAASKLFILLWPLLAVRMILPPGEGARVSWRARLRALPLGLLSGAALSGLVLLALQTPLAAILEASAPAIRGKAAQMGILDWYGPFALFLALGNSLVEEYYWRWFLYGRLRGFLGVWPALLLASGAFALHHVVVTSQFFPQPWGVLMGLCVGVAGAAWCLLYERQGTVAGVWVSHLVADLAVLSVGYWAIF